MKKTKKTDWMNDALAGAGAFVSDHSSYSQRIGLDDRFKVSLRFLGNAKIGYFIFLVIISEEETEVSSSLANSIFDHLSYIEKHGVEVKAAIICDIEKYHIISDRTTSILEKQDLAAWFGNINEELSRRQTTAVKLINKSMNDKFQEFTREQLSNYITCNDIDAVLPFNSADGPRFALLELKRPVESIDGWRPYSADLANYKAMLRISDEAKGVAVTIAYNEEGEDDFLLLRYSIENLHPSTDLRLPIQQPKIWKWLITRERMSPRHPIYQPSPYPGKQPGWISYWISMDINANGSTSKLLIDTSRKSIFGS